MDRRQIGRHRTRSDFEAAFLAVLDAHGLPRPITDEPVGRYIPDALWPRARLIVELDGRQAHATTKAFEEDRARDRDLQAAGYRVLGITWRQLRDDAATIARQIRAMLG